MPTKSEMAGALRWCRDKFASWFATTWLYVILWAVVSLVFSVLLYIDAVFSRGLAPESVNPLSFQGMGIAYRLFTAAFLMAAARCLYKGIKGRWTFRALGLFSSIIVCLHAFGFGFEALSDRRDQAMATREVIEVQANGKAELIAALEGRKATIDTDTAKAVATLDAEITQYITDGKNNDYLADDARERRNKLQDEARAEKAAIDAEVMGLMREAADGKVESVTANANVKPWAPLFVGIAQLVTWSKEPTDWAIYLCAIGFVIFWVLLGESLVIFLPERIYTMHLHDAESRGVSVSEDVPAGHVRVEMPEDEWAAYQAAKEVHDNIKGGAKKGARTRRQGNKIEQSRQYAEDRISEFMVERNKGLSTAQIAAKFGLTVATMDMQYGSYMTAEEYAALFGTGYQPEPEPEPPVAVSDSPQDEPEPEEEPTPDNIPPPDLMGEGFTETPEETTDLNGGEVSEIGGEVSEPDDELTIPDEPKEYGIEVWQGQTDDPANEDDDEDLKEAASV